ncbi:C2 domain-containing protein 2 [Polypterus senegalus]|uniref:C2 domain-containing protein 2 n=1 Tax=Polypterus senegalus TaxID=55291 RepID=UPI0019665F1A|nr:C2 domain-containing protein 2 [Polypterus senegalus]
MSLLESILAYLDAGDMQWFCLLTLFVASLVTVAVYFVQSALSSFRFRERRGANSAAGEAAALLDWVLALPSWRRQWRRAWLAAINEEAKRLEGSSQLIFEENNLEQLELVVINVSSFREINQCKVARCEVAGESVSLSVNVAHRTANKTELQMYDVKIQPLQLQLELQLKESEGDIQVMWSFIQLDDYNFSLSPKNKTEGSANSITLKKKICDIICSAHPSVVLSTKSLDEREFKNIHLGSIAKETSPPKPPRAHEWKLLVKNIRVTFIPETSAAGSINPYCLIELDEPPQKLSSQVLKNSASPSWEQPFIFELGAKSKELTLQILDNDISNKNSLVGQASVPFDLFKKHPNGKQTFALKNNDQLAGSVSAEFSYLDSSELRSWPLPTPVPAKKVEMDRTVMPCGTVVTTVTAVKTKPGRSPSSLSSDSPLKASFKAKVSERSVSQQSSPSGATVSKALSSSDTELLMLNGTDPVAEVAIRQLHESAKHKMKSPIKKSTIIISGVSKTPVSQDDEMTLMMGYAAAMDASLNHKPHSAEPDPTVQAHTSDQLTLELQDPKEEPSLNLTHEWDNMADHNSEADKISHLSVCIADTTTVKKSKGSFLQKSAKLFFRRRRHRKDPGMSQSHNDLVYLDHPETVEKDRKTAAFTRIINKKLLPKNKHRNNPNGSVVDPNA